MDNLVKDTSVCIVEGFIRPLDGSRRKLNIFGAKLQHISCFARSSMNTIFQSPTRTARMSPSSLT